MFCGEIRRFGNQLRPFLLLLFLVVSSTGCEELSQEDEEWICQCDLETPFSVKGSEQCYATRLLCEQTENTEECLNCFNCSGCGDDAPWSASGSVYCYYTLEDCVARDGDDCVKCN